MSKLCLLESFRIKGFSRQLIFRYLSKIFKLQEYSKTWLLIISKMQNCQSDSEDQQIIIVVGDKRPIPPVPKRSKICLTITAIFTLLLFVGYLLFAREAFHQSEEAALHNENTQIQIEAPQPISNLQDTSPTTTQIQTKTFQPKSSLQNASSLSSFYEYTAQLSQLQQLINKIQQSATVHLCLLPQKLFHYYQSNTKVMYFQTAYQLILPSCQIINHYPWSIDRENIHSWNHNRQVIEWALKYVRPKDHIFYYRPNNYNILQITMLSKIVGEQGSITIFDSNEISVCMRSVTNFHGIRTQIRYFSLNFFESNDRYNVFIINDSNYFSSKITSSKKSLIYTQDPNTLNKYKGVTIKKVNLSHQTCSQLQLSGQLSDKGFYSLLKDGEEQTRKPLVKSTSIVNSMRAIVESEYNRFKQIYKSSAISKQQFLLGLRNEKTCYNIKSSRRQQDFIYTIYGHKIYNVSLEELQGWQKEREAVEWVRYHQSNSTGKDVYYEIKSKFNMLSIFEIAFLLGNHTLTVVCLSAQCERIGQTIKSNHLQNVQLIKLSDSKKALSSGIIITDNQFLITAILESNFLLSGFLLGLFSYKNANSLALIRRLYVNYHLREVAIDNTKRQCIGFQYRHFFWRSWQPQGFYDFTLLKDVMYAFWGGHPSKLNIMKKLLVEEVVSMNLQTKILSTETFLPFQLANSPIHPAFHLLTSIQKSDYMRVYLMHHYGGGYTDVKHIHVDCKPYLEEFKQQQGKLALGYAEIHDFDVPCFDEGAPTCREIISQYHRIIGNGYYFFKKQTVLTTEWFNRVTANLDMKLDDLRKNPHRVPREALGRNYTLPDGTRFTSKYPFRWAEIANEHLVRVQYKYLDNISTALPYLINVDYRTKDNMIQN